MAYIIPCIADTHIGSTLGLLHPDGAILDDGETRHPNQIQLWLHERYASFLADVRSIRRPADKVIGLLNGDAVDLIQQSSQLISTNPVDILKAAVKVLTPYRELCRDGLFVLRGTEAHTGKSGALEEALARELDATKWPATSGNSSAFWLEAEIGGVRLDVTHHGRSGMLSWTKGNAAGSTAIELVLQYAQRGKAAPHIAIRAHRHVYYDSGDTYPVRIIGLPCWQMQNAYGHKVAPGKLPDIGGAIITIDDGRADVQSRLYRPATDNAWSPEP